MNIHSRGFWMDRDVTHRFDRRLMKGLVRLARKYDIESIADIGCGDGSYTVAFLAKGIGCNGYDGNPHTKDLTQGLCRVCDFSLPQVIGSYDMTLSLEVGEHIPVQHEDIFLNNIAMSAMRLVVISWAVEGQGGDGHVNCRNNDYIIEKMEERGFKYNPKESKRLRRKARISWFKNTILVYEKEN